MKTLLILRHAKSSWKKTGLPDHDRPLNKRGQRDAPRMGLLLRDLGLVPDLILSSPARRARQTAQTVAEESGYEGEVLLEPAFYPGDPEDFVAVLQQLPPNPQRVMVVGHNPGLEALLEDLTGAYERLPTAALAQVRLPIEDWRELDQETEGTLVDLWLPRQLT